MESLQNKTVSGVIWRLSQTFFSSGLSFLFALFLTRMLSPSDYGLIGMLMVFITLSQAFIDCGFGQALIRKENRTTVDESTVFYFNLGASLICYGILFVIAPWVADFYNMPILCQLLRVLGLNVILGALSAIQGLLYTIKLDFRTPMLVAFVSNMIAGSIALFMAYQGYGVWSLVAQQLLRTLSITLIYYAISSWRPILAFSRDTFHEMFSFGVNILGSSILNTMYNQINKMVIGKFYSAADLGMYAKSEELLAFPCNTIYSTLSSVSYPVLCRMQSDKERLTSVYQRFVGVISFFVTPIMALMGVFSRDLFRVLCSV
jgi:O-antigen/teichoic acid export membrane protein